MNKKMKNAATNLQSQLLQSYMSYLKNNYQNKKPMGKFNSWENYAYGIILLCQSLNISVETFLSYSISRVEAELAYFIKSSGAYYKFVLTDREKANVCTHVRAYIMYLTHKSGGQTQNRLAA